MDDKTQAMQEQTRERRDKRDELPFKCDHSSDYPHGAECLNIGRRVDREPVICPDCGSDVGEHVCLLPRDGQPRESSVYDYAPGTVSPAAESDWAEDQSSAAKRFIDANVWDGEDRSGTPDGATFTPDSLQELVDDLLEHVGQTAARAVLAAPESATAEQLTWQANRIVELEGERDAARGHASAYAGDCLKTEDDLADALKRIVDLENELDKAKRGLDKAFAQGTTDYGDDLRKTRIERDDAELRCKQLRDVPCPKCNAHQWDGPEYRSVKQHMGCGVGVNANERLVYACTRCRYERAEPCADADEDEGIDLDVDWRR